jgi:hypothetical protein
MKEENGGVGLRLYRRRKGSLKDVIKERLNAEIKEAVHGGVYDWRFTCVHADEEETVRRLLLFVGWLC